MAPTFNAIGLTVADLGKSLAFYRLLGLDLPADADNAPHAEAPLPGGNRLMWDQGGKSKINLAFACADPAEVDDTHAALVKAGYESHQEPWDAPWGQRYAVVLDPDGNGVDLYAPSTS
ncbi:VOC family protein [Winogradskya humida]|uniref:Glyoxalase n=1 Tax=Winogradskya humida TaxID=113566 RepID=A0ABQ4A2X8_9ACTN|nr:VOC family protein [Actinoplanes humidus]GIE25214.1 glyoxalase [Actinoplanes humidus]